MDTSTAGPQSGSPSKTSRQAARKGADVTPNRKHLPSNSGATSLTNPRERSRATADLPPDDQDAEDSGSGNYSKLLSIRGSRPKGPAGWSYTHQLMWLELMGKLPPRVILERHLRPLKSTATPSQVDLADITIPLTGKELLTFFPNHANIQEYQDRFRQNGIGGTFQAMFISHQYRLQGLEIVIPMDIRTYVKTAGSKYGPDKSKRCTTYTTTHYTFKPGNANGFDNIMIPYPLIDCAASVAPCDYPMGLDSGPFTKALIHAQIAERENLLLSELDAYIETWGFSRELEKGYTDEDFQTRHWTMKGEYEDILKAEMKNNGFKWEA